MGQLLHTAGFVDIFIEANYLTRDWSNAVFYRGTCHVMLQHFAVYITLDFQVRDIMKDYYKDRSEQPVDQITARIEGAYFKFFASFYESAGIQHSLSKGEVRENPVRDFFDSLLPTRFSVTADEIIDSRGRISPQSDLIVYRASDGIPVLNMQPTILQVESVMCVTEVKSEINISEYKDCLAKATKLFKLRPFDTPLQKYERGRDPGAEDCRIFISIFAYGSNTKGGLKEETERYLQCAKDLGVDPSIIDRIYILDKGVINPADGRYAEDTYDRKIGLFYYYSNMLQFAMRESNRRKEVPYVYYFGRMSEGWKKI